MSDQLFDISGQVVLVSGGSRGIGKAIAAGFAERGATVIISSRDKAVLEATASEIGAEAVVCDVSDDAQVAACIEQVLGNHERIDTLINVAGVNHRKRAETYTTDEFDFILDINLRGAFLMSQAVGTSMLANKSGNIINIDSLNTVGPLKGVAPYAMSKGGLQMMTRALALEWGPRGVRVNGLAPGFILTDLTQTLWAQPHMQKWNSEVCPLGRLGEVGDLVGTAIFLASPAAAFLTGQTIYVDGGVVAGRPWPIDL